MSSTSREQKERVAREFFARELSALAAATRDHRDRYFPLGADPGRESYFTRRQRTRMEKADFEDQAVASAPALAEALAALWSRTGDSELAVLAPRFAALAEQVYDVDTETEGVTPFMYVMF